MSLKKEEIIALKLMGTTCRSCANFWQGSYCTELTDIDSPICGAFKPLEDQKCPYARTLSRKEKSVS